MKRKLFIIITFLPVLLLLLLSWMIMLVLLIIPLIMLFAYKNISGSLSYNSKTNWISANVDHRRQARSSEKQNGIVFNRIDDESKIIGCNTRNVQYRWKIFTNALERLQNTSTTVLKALDVGAGSLRDTYQLSNLGFKVTAVDINKNQLELSYNKYDWSQAQYKPNIQARSIVDLDRRHCQYDLILAFDVIEHLIELDDTIEQLRNKLSENGFIFISVPNRLTLFEKIYKVQHKRRLGKGTIDKSGMPHVNFMTPHEWKQFFQNKGFIVNDHDMTIGFFVNDVWHGFYGIASRIFFESIIRRIATLLGMRYRALSFEGIFYPRWLMKFVNELDETTKKYFKERWAWNLFVLSRSN